MLGSQRSRALVRDPSVERANQLLFPLVSLVQRVPGVCIRALLLVSGLLGSGLLVSGLLGSAHSESAFLLYSVNGISLNLLCVCACVRVCVLHIICECL